MTLTSLDIQNKTFQKKKFGGFDPDEVDDFLDQIVHDYEDVIQKNRELEKDLKHSREKLGYFDELKDSLNESIIVAQDTANKVKSNASNEAEVIVKSANQHAEETITAAQAKADRILADARSKATEMITESANNAKQLARETEDLKKKTRGFHQRLSLMLESQLQTVKSNEWDDLLKPFSSYVDEHTVLKEVLKENDTQETVEKELESIVEPEIQAEPLDPIAKAQAIFDAAPKLEDEITSDALSTEG
ncbi:cell division initiation protein [Pilibacter termitis]|uniref:Cell division initiation protein n=1 Tax=Pilibacter termitis TaxID=263852 RepID=A0A1T4M4W0_9ENTE|nr:DivIVA domain-containing protein [Pilibacter termitis]SJZ61886.1 cell division initiation protein [Pilibacter termitis]